MISNGENIIVVTPGSNDNLFPKDLPELLFEPNKFDIILLQLEIGLVFIDLYYFKKIFNKYKQKI